MRVSNYLRKELLNASKIAFKESPIVLFGSRIDDEKRGGDFDLAVMQEMNRDDLKSAKVAFFKYLLLKDLDLPIDIVLYSSANELLKKEINKGEIL